MKELLSDKAGLECIIDNSIFNFIYVLLKNIFLKSGKSEEILNKWIQKINKYIIKSEKNYINLDYSISNFNNIMNFIKSQNNVYAAEILEYILIKIFAEVIEVNQDKTINSYIYNNLNKIRNDKNYLNWFHQEKFKPRELNNLKQIIDKEDILSFHNSPFCYLIYRINYEKFNLIKISQEKNNKIIKYIFNDCIPEQTILDNIYESTKNKEKNIFDEDLTENSIMYIYSNFKQKNISDNIKVYVHNIKDFLYSVFIYYQTKNSPLINYGIEEKDSENMAKVPYTYDLTGAIVEGKYAKTIISPIRVEGRVANIFLGQTNIREMGMFELGKTLVFNKNINTLQLNLSLLSAHYLDYLILGMGIFDNKSLKELNLSSNFLKGNIEKSLRKIIHKFKGLKTLNISKNEIKDGLSSFFLILKRLFQKNEINIENLVLNDCYLDDSSFYELGELLKNKFCKIKKLYLMKNDIPKITHFLKKIKKNKILTDLFIGETNIGNSDTNDIKKIISNTSIKNLYMYKNNISNFKEALRIMNRTRIVNKNINEKNGKLIEKSNSILKSLDISGNQIINKNIIYIKLFKEISEKTSLFLLDFSKVLYEKFPDKFEKISKNKKYRCEVDNLVNILSGKKKKYQELIIKLRNLEIDMKRLKEEKFDYNKFNKMENIISNIIKDKKAKFPLYLREIAVKLIQDYYNGINENDEEMVIKLVNYMMKKRIKNNLDEIKEKKEFYNMILI